MEQVADLRSQCHGCDEDIYAFVDTVFANNLHSQEFFCITISKSFNNDVPAAGRSCFVRTFDVHYLDVVACLARLIFAQTCSGNAEVKDTENPGSQNSPESQTATGDCITADPPGLVSGRTQRKPGGFLPDQVIVLDTVTAGIDMGVTGLHALINCERLGRSLADAGILGQTHFGPDTCGHDHDVAGYFFALSGQNIAGFYLSSLCILVGLNTVVIQVLFQVN